MERPSLSTQARELLLVAGPAALVCIAAFWLALQFVQPAPPKSIRMTAGGVSGAYYGFGQTYAARLKKAGIDLDVAPSAGSIENVQRLQDPASGYHLALVQGGIASAATAPDLVSLGRVFLEPLWVFHRNPVRLTRLAELRGQKLAVAGEGSGTRKLAEALLSANGVTAETATLLPLSGQPAVDALRAGSVDAIFLAVAPEAPVIQELLRDPAVKIMSLSQAEAYTRRFPYLTRVVLPKGVVDLAANVPSEDVELVAAQAAVVARKDIHPALAGLMVDVLADVHSGGGMFHRIAEFPKGVDPEYPVSEDAERIYKNGQPFFQRFLPFWLANFIERMLVMVVPFATILIPLAKLVPWLYDWRIRQRLLYWYAQLKALETRIGPARQSGAIAEHRAEIERIEAAVSHIPVPLQYSDRLYELRGAIDLVRSRISPA